MSRTSRRQFLRATAATALASCAAGYSRIIGANDRLTFGIVGVGHRGKNLNKKFSQWTEEHNIDVIANCDVYVRRLKRAIATQEEYKRDGTVKIRSTLEYRELLDDRDIDVIVIATPDHWHAKIALEAIDAGKIVYCEKPMTHTVEEAVKLRDAVHESGRLFAVGPNLTSDDVWWKAGELIRQGRIGKPVWSQACYSRNSLDNEWEFNWPIEEDASPQASKSSDGYVWWDRWLGWEHGLAPRIPWNPDRFFRFRKYWDYGGGIATDLLYHLLAPLLIATEGPGGAYPRKAVSGGGRYIQKDEREIPDIHLVTLDYPREHTIFLASAMTNDQCVPRILRGQYGTIEVLEEGLKVTEQWRWASSFRQANREHFPEDHSGIAPGTATFDVPADEIHEDLRFFRHEHNFLEALRGDAELSCNVDLGATTMVGIKMAVESLRQEKVMLWDAEGERMVPS